MKYHTRKFCTDQQKSEMWDRWERGESLSSIAAALLMPYETFHDEVLKARYDIDVLSTRFSVSYEQVCHRLTTLQRPGQRGIPFFFAD